MSYPDGWTAVNARCVDFPLAFPSPSSRSGGYTAWYAVGNREVETDFADLWICVFVLMRNMFFFIRAIIAPTSAQVVIHTGTRYK